MPPARGGGAARGPALRPRQRRADQIALARGVSAHRAANDLALVKGLVGELPATLQRLAVGAISEADHANSIIAAGRADLCAIARPHLANPAWTLTEAAKIGYTPIVWPKQYFQGKRQMEALFEREKALK